jgi:uncharacterized membrane protein
LFGVLSTLNTATGSINQVELSPNFLANFLFIKIPSAPQSMRALVLTIFPGNLNLIGKKNELSLEIIDMDRIAILQRLDASSNLVYEFS